ncbi:hypothetical protein ACOME3_006553 [Neoechinorhynchus agilis]
MNAESKLELELDQIEVSRPKWILFLNSYRLRITVLLSFAIFSCYAQRNGLSSAITGMVKDDKGNGYYDWKTRTGIILGSFYIGYALVQFVGGYVVARTDAHRTLSIFLTMSTISTLICPFAANKGVGTMVASRIVAGIGQALAWPSLYSVAAAWFPPKERSTHMGLVGASQAMGTVVSLYLGGIFCKINNTIIYYISGWALFFYLLGFIGLVWLLLWMLYGSRSPQNCRRINKYELNYIESNVVHTTPASNAIPWKAIAQSKEVWGLCLTMMFYDFGLYATYTVVPQYLKDALKYSYSEMGLYSALPHVVCTIGSILNGYFADKLINGRVLSRTNCRKFFQSGSSLLVGLSMLMIAFVPPERRKVAVVLFLFCGFFISMAFAGGYFVAVSDIGGNYSAIIYGIGNTMSAIAGFISPTLPSTIVGSETRNVASKWKTVLMVYSGSLFLSSAIYGILGSGEQCSWAKDPENHQENDAIEHREQDL